MVPDAGGPETAGLSGRLERSAEADVGRSAWRPGPESKPGPGPGPEQGQRSSAALRALPGPLRVLLALGVRLRPSVRL